jgi:hypothetical protein
MGLVGIGQRLLFLSDLDYWMGIVLLGVYRCWVLLEVCWDTML